MTKGFDIPDCKCVKETEKALLIQNEELGEVWVPKSQVTEDSEVYELGGEGELVVTEWFAEKQAWL